MPLETRREFTGHALRSLTALALIEGLSAHRLFGADVRPIVDGWFKELESISRDVHDHRVKDVTQALAKWDRQTVDDFAQRSWLGYAEEHWVELDFGDRLAKFKPDDRLILCLAGWTDYPYPESIWAATQAGILLLPPTLERLDDKGRWQTVIADAGFPAGLPRRALELFQY